jgi:hypothetical protein
MTRLKTATRRGLVLLAPALAIVAGIAASGKTAHGAGEDKAEFNERCATRLSIAMLGQSPSAQFFTTADPQASIDQILANPAFIERFSRYINSTFNSGPGAAQTDDAVYYLTKHVITNAKPWSDLFIGQYKVDLDASKNMVVTPDPTGLGYFRSVPWQRRYAGNEPGGYKISTAYRMVNNVVGVELIPSTNKPGDDRTATGRHAPACSSCHYDNWDALDLIAKVLTKRVGTGDTMTFTPPSEGPQKVLDGEMVNDDGEFINTMVKSDQFKFRACRIAFNFLYGRNENECEAPLFDKCVDEFTAKGTIQAAIATVAKDPGFCQ